LPLLLRESDVEELLSPEEAVEAIEACFERMARGAAENLPRSRVRLDDGLLHVMAAADRELGVAGLKSYVGFPDGARFVVALFSAVRPELLALIDADRLGQRRTGAASAVAARHLAKENARSLGMIGCGWQAESQVEAIRAALPAIERVVVFCRNEERRSDFCRRFAADPAEWYSEAAEQDIVVTITTSRDPVLRGEWLRPGALVCAVGANRIQARELDNAVLERASFVCCDWKEQARLEAGDLVEPVERGVLDWLEVHDLAEVVGGEVTGRQSADDVVVFKSVGIASEDLAVAKLVLDRARQRGLGTEI
jgi:alanine dehydrogenase